LAEKAKGRKPLRERVKAMKGSAKALKPFAGRACSLGGKKITSHPKSFWVKPTPALFE